MKPSATHTGNSLPGATPGTGTIKKQLGATHMLKTTPKYLVKTNKCMYARDDYKSAIELYRTLFKLGLEPELIADTVQIVTVRIY